MSKPTEQINIGDNIRCISIGEIMKAGYQFLIPKYQRGYRWTKAEVDFFVDDIVATRIEGGGWNCIQPLVVARRDKKWEVIDGQQRLTTIYLILKALGENPGFSIEYETREDSGEFLRDIDKSEGCNKNADYYFMRKSFDAIDKKLGGSDNESFRIKLLERTKFIWYAPPDVSEPQELFARLNIGKIKLSNAELVKAILLKRSGVDSVGYAARRSEIAVLWDQMEYTFHDDEFWCFLFNPKDAEKYPCLRLDALLELWARYRDANKGTSYNPRNRDYYILERVEVFLKEKEGSSGLSRAEAILDLWEELRSIYNVLHTWYSEQEIYHYLGYLQMDRIRSKSTAMEQLVVRLQQWNESPEKGDFIRQLKKEIRGGRGIGFAQFKKYVDKRVNGRESIITEDEEKLFSYGSTYTWRILILYNVLTYLTRVLGGHQAYKTVATIGFPFNLFKREGVNGGWDVEHVASNAGDNLETDGNQKSWLLSVYEALDVVKDRESGDTKDATLGGKDADIREEIKNYLQRLLTKSEGDTPTEQEFDTLRDHIREQCTWFQSELDDSDKDSIMNLVLLDRKTNRGFKNDVYPMKRRWILARERGESVGRVDVKLVDGKLSIVRTDTTEGTYSLILPCTKNVFTKSYKESSSANVGWNIEDARFYLADIRNVLNKYLS